MLFTLSRKLPTFGSLMTLLKAQGHCTLLYSQMTLKIDLLGEYTVYRKRARAYVRLDGSSEISERRDTVADFQSRAYNFAFPLSMKARELDMSLTTGDNAYPTKTPAARAGTGADMAMASPRALEVAASRAGRTVVENEQQTSPLPQQQPMTTARPKCLGAFMLSSTNTPLNTQGKAWLRPLAASFTRKTIVLHPAVLTDRVNVVVFTGIFEDDVTHHLWTIILFLWMQSRDMK
ncbi:hypothetical protein SKAU_G00337950 [Synaphobranchus kaupii]|uniref:Chromatin-remodeling ATPase INO80 n=1 Tax=Synaphobranchus kaupii TaxID=118154 RepID=A0A9Q1IJ87_SYNKA|nr:hypothetical protein SKAU_G00337950 [Synaphobranchus kaupii]